MKIAVVQLSDIHLSTKGNPILQKKDKLFDAIKNEAYTADKVIIAVTGDIAFSGDKEEYLIAKKLLDDLILKITEYTKKKCSVVMIPGNHDCAFNEKKEVTRELVLKGLEAGKYKDLDDNSLQLCTQPQENYFEFVKNQGYNKGDEILSEHKLLTSLKFNLGEFSIIFHCYNTSWDSRMKELQGRMALPISLFDRRTFKYNANVIISLIHHPFNWQNASSGREARFHLEATSDFVLSGHEHESENYMRKSDNDTTYYIEAGALQESGNSIQSEFGLLMLDVEKKEFKFERFELRTSGDRYSKVKDVAWQPLMRSKSLTGSEYEISDRFYFDFLEDPGSKFMHSQQDRIRLSDIFVYPNLRKIYDVRESAPKQAEILSGENLMGSLDESQIRLIFVGEDGCGKTSFCKFIYAYLWNKQFIPVYLNCEAVNVKWTSEAFTKKVYATISDQYENMTEDIASQIDRAKIVLILDDFKYLKGSSEGMAKFVHNINKVFTHIIITGNAQLQFEPITTNKKEFVDAYRDYTQLRITEFGKDLRYKLIDKWNKIGRVDVVPKNEILRMNDDAMRKMDSIVGKNFLPPYPIYLLTLIQSLESMSATNADYSLQGYYYDFLISDSLNKAIRDKEAMSFYYNIISEYAYELFSDEKKMKPVGRDYFDKFFNKYKNKYAIGIGVETVLANLLKARIIVQDENNNIAIAYNYIYYFFIAKFLSAKIHDEKIRIQIKDMCSKLFREEYSNVILFLVHLSNDPMILTEIEYVAKSLFAVQPICRLDTDILEINAMIEKMPEQVIELMDVEQAREQEYKHRTQVETEGGNNISQQKFEGPADEESPVDVIGQIVFAFKIIDILGQVTKKHWGDLPGPRKLELAQETYSLGLRTLSQYLMILSQGKDILAEHIKSLIESKQIKQRDKIGQFSKNFIFRLSFMASYGIVKRISNAIGYNKLKLTFDELLEKMRVPSVELIDLSIKLDHGNGFPIDDVIRLNGTTHEKNYMAWLLLKNLVMDYMYLFETSPKTKQQLQDLLGISIKAAITIDNTSGVKRE
jgi:UDP-2,3-diacylglucosamine pyrophosphatase LpxH